MNPQGVVEGGWNFIWAAYAITWVFLGSYGVSLFLRRAKKE